MESILIAIVLAIATQAVCVQLPDKTASFNGQSDQLDQYKSYVYTWKTNITEELSQYEFTIESPSFPAIGYHFNAKARLRAQNWDTYISLAFIDEGKGGATIPFKLLPKVTYTLRDLKGAGKDIVLSSEHPFASTMQFNQFYEQWIAYQSSLIDYFYNKSDSMIIDIAIEPPSVANAIASTDGTFAGAIDRYSLRKQLKVWRNSYSTPYFYTSPGGFRVKMDMLFEGAVLRAAFSFLTGENDSNLGGSFAHNVTIFVFNQFDSTKHLVQTVQHDIKDSGIYDVHYFDYNDLENGGFVTDDTLYYKVVVIQS